MWSSQRSCLISSLLLSAASFAVAFVPASARPSFAATTKLQASTTSTDYDIVKVDLSDGRDYPIYIGAGFSDEEGACFYGYYL
jgi:hypothetical protein